MGDKGSTPEQMAHARGQQVSAASWLSRLKQQRERVAAQQPVTKQDLVKVQMQLKNEIERGRANRASMGQVAGRGAKMLAHGFSQINKSMANVDAPKNRMAIAQLPSPKKSPLRGQGWDLSRLQDPALRGRDLRGKRIR